MMTTFNESLHPRGQAGNAGQFATKTHDAPNGVLTHGPSTIDIATEIAQSYGSYRTFTEGLVHGEIDADGIRQMLQRIAGGQEAERIIDENYDDFEAFHAAVADGDVDADGVEAMVGAAMRARDAAAPPVAVPARLRTANDLFSSPPMVADIPRATDKELHNAEIESYYRQGDREISDAAAIAIARDILHNFPDSVEGGPDGATHQLRRVAAGTPISPDDHDAVDELHEELGRVYKRGAGSGGWGARDRRIDSMFTWALNGGDNTR